MQYGFLCAFPDCFECNSGRFQSCRCTHSKTEIRRLLPGGRQPGVYTQPHPTHASPHPPHTQHTPHQVALFNPWGDWSDCSTVSGVECTSRVCWNMDSETGYQTSLPKQYLCSLQTQYSSQFSIFLSFKTCIKTSFQTCTKSVTKEPVTNQL